MDPPKPAVAVQLPPPEVKAPVAPVAAAAAAPAAAPLPAPAPSAVASAPAPVPAPAEAKIAEEKYHAADPDRLLVVTLSQGRGLAACDIGGKACLHLSLPSIARSLSFAAVVVVECFYVFFGF